MYAFVCFVLFFLSRWFWYAGNPCSAVNNFRCFGQNIFIIISSQYFTKKIKNLTECLAFVFLHICWVTIEPDWGERDVCVHCETDRFSVHININRNRKLVLKTFGVDSEFIWSHLEWIQYRFRVDLLLIQFWFLVDSVSIQNRFSFDSELDLVIVDSVLIRCRLMVKQTDWHRVSNRTHSPTTCNWRELEIQYCVFGY